MRTRLPALDIFRGLAILAVVFIHVSGHFLHRLRPETPDWYALAIPNRALQFAVPAFLMLSAFLMLRRLQDGRRPVAYLCRHVPRLLWPYLLFSAIGIAYGYRHDLYGLHGRHVLMMLVWGKGAFHLYFLALLFQLYAMLPLLAPLARRRPPFWLIAITVLGLQLTVYALNRYVCHWPYVGSLLFWYVPSVALGLWLSGQAERLGQLSRKGLLPSAFLAVMAFAAYNSLATDVLLGKPINTFSFQVSEWGYTACASFLLLAVCLRLPMGAGTSLLQKCGIYSFPIYLLHPFVIVGLDWALPREMAIGQAILVYFLVCLMLPLGLSRLLSPFDAVRWQPARRQAIAVAALSGLLLIVPVKGQSAPILRQLVDCGWKPNAALHAQVTPLPGVQANGKRVRCYTVRYTSHLWRGQPVRIFGFYACPADHARQHPALLWVHGGGGYATLGRVVEAAGRGFAALSIDLPGKGTHREKFSRSTGPDMTVPQIFTVQPTVSDSYIYHAVLAQMRAITFLTSRPEVDARRIGLIGASWGGATGLITTSLDRRVKCFVDIFGSGFVREGSCWGGYFHRLLPGQLKIWEDNYDSSRYVSDIHVPVLGISATNDGCYWLPEFMKTMRAIHPTPDLICLPNLNHKINLMAREGFYRWLETHLPRAACAGEPKIYSLCVQQNGVAGLGVSISATGPHPVQSAEVWYVPVIPKQGDVARQWSVSACAQTRSGVWSSRIAFATRATYFFATVHFADGSVRSTPIQTAVRCTLDHEPTVLQVPFMHVEPSWASAYYREQCLAGLSPATDPAFWNKYPAFVPPHPQSQRHSQWAEALPGALIILVPGGLFWLTGRHRLRQNTSVRKRLVKAAQSSILEEQTGSLF